MKRSVITSLIISLLFLLSEVKGQEVLINGEDKISGISINKDGRLHLLYEDNLCVFEGNQIVDECYVLTKKVNYVVPIEDGFFALIYEDQIELIKNNQLISSDTLPNVVTSVALYHQTILLGTSGSGIYQYGIDDFKLNFLGLEGEFINALLIDHLKLFIALDDGISMYDFKLEKFEKKALGHIISKLSFIQKGTILAISEDNKVFKMDSLLQLLAEKTLKNIRINKISNTFFITSEACYEFDSLLNAQKVIEGSFDDLLELPNTLLLAKESSLYGIDLTVKSIETNDKVYSIYSENNTSLWIGTNNYVHQYNEDTLTLTLKIPSKLPQVIVSSILVINDLIFAGTMGDGLFILNKEGKLIKHVLDNSENNRNNIIQLSHQDSLIWAAYLNGITTIDVRTLKPIEEFNDILGNNYLYCFEPVSATEFFVGTSSLGLIHYKNGEINNYLDGEAIYSLKNSSSGLLIGTKDNGVFLQQQSGISLIEPNNSIRSITSNEDMVLLFSNDKSLMYSNNVVYPISNNSLQNAQLNAITEDENTINVGFSNGFLRINKERLKQLKKIGLHLNKPMLFNEQIPNRKNHFEHSENSLSFAFHQNTYYKIANTIYQYRLLGLDSNWQQTQQNKINFYNLDPGEYTFEVASSFAGNSNLRNKQQYSFTIRRPFWQTTWFILAMVLVAGMLIFLIIKAREKKLIQQNEREKEKVRFVLEKLKNQIDPHFLFNSFNSLIGLIEENPKSAIEATQLLSDLYRNILTYEKLDLIGLKEELELAKSYFYMHQIRFEDLVSLNIEISKEEEKNGKLIPLSCQFLIENAIKHNVINQDHKLYITIKKEGSYLEVSNTFRPKDQDENAKSGLGLKNLKERYSHFSNLAVLIQNSSSHFTVKIPIIYD